MSKASNGYEDMSCRLDSPEDWDVVGLIEDVSDRLNNSGDGEASAVIDALLQCMQEIASRISPDHAKVITPDTISEAADIAAKFVE